MRHQVYEPLAQGDPDEIGGYRILARLGAGGMGRVYLAATQSGRKLAIKVVRPEFADDREFRRRFAQEVTAAQRVQNLYTAAVIDADLDGPMPWLATVHVPGPSLAEAVAESGPLPPSALPTLGAGVAEALQSIHRTGIVHRDLKPSNVLLADDGPRVIDFGIARAADATPLTRTGGVIGSPQFMAPEQVRGDASTTAVDIFAFGTLLHFAATGLSPFGEGDPQAVMFRIVQEAPRLDRCPEALRPIIERCLAKDPANRPSDAELLGELTAMQSSQSAVWPPEPVTEHLRAYREVPAPTRILGEERTATLPAGAHEQPQYGAPEQPRYGAPEQPRYGAPTRVSYGAPTPPPHGAPTPPPHGTPAPAYQGTSPPRPPHGMPAPPPPGAHTPYPPVRSGGSGCGKTLLLVGGGLVALLLVLGFIVKAGQSGRDGNQSGTAKGAGKSTASPRSGGGKGGKAKKPGTLLARYNKIDISSGYTINFAENPKRPKKGEGGDLEFLAGNIRGDGKFGPIERGRPATYKTCHDNTKYIEERIFQPDAGTTWCVYTESGLLGIVHIRAKNYEFMNFDLNVWQGPAD
ncbi:serine/threonine-protein kinase [Actinomadura luteofluorescens]|uniref:serine/threonine-protein kinase n=1 Tax=Actinomadura luteofluorescens TaxID=46163 RepID=UPI00346B5962